MTEAPEYWWQVTGVAAVMMIIACFAVIGLLSVLIVMLLQLKRSLLEITGRIQTIADRVDSVAKQVEQVTTEVGSRTIGIARTVDDIAFSAFEVVERYAPLAIGVAVLFKLRSLFGKKK